MVPDSSGKPLTLVDNFATEVTLFTNGINPEHLGVEIIFGKKIQDKVEKILYKRELQLVEARDKIARFAVDVPTYKAGSYSYAFRIFPRHKLMPHQQDCNLVKWV